MKSARLQDDVHHAAKRRAADEKTKIEDVLDSVLRPALVTSRKPRPAAKAK